MPIFIPISQKLKQELLSQYLRPNLILNDWHLQMEQILQTLKELENGAQKVDLKLYKRNFLLPQQRLAIALQNKLILYQIIDQLDVYHIKINLLAPNTFQTGLIKQRINNLQKDLNEKMEIIKNFIQQLKRNSQRKEIKIYNIFVKPKSDNQSHSVSPVKSESEIQAIANLKTKQKNQFVIRKKSELVPPNIIYKIIIDSPIKKEGRTQLAYNLKAKLKQQQQISQSKQAYELPKHVQQKSQTILLKEVSKK